MSVRLTLAQAADILKQAQDVLILTHKSPDGDTLGSAYALMHALKKLGKRADVLCNDAVAPRYRHLNGEQPIVQPHKAYFEPKTVVSVDTADTQLLGEHLQRYADQVDLCVDHHGSNSGYAKNLLLRADAAANCELVLDLIEAMGVPLDSQIADCLYTGLVTDTGCFRYTSTTVESHLAAQKLMQAGANVRLIHQRMFESVSRGKTELMITALQSLRYELDGVCAVMILPRDKINECEVTDDELEGISTVPREIEGVRVGVTLRQYKSYRGYKVSVRTDGLIDASAICARLGGGGHVGAAGCNIENEPLEEVYRRVLAAVAAEL